MHTKYSFYKLLLISCVIAICSCSTQNKNLTGPSEEEEHNTTVFILSTYGYNENQDIQVLLQSVLSRLKSGIQATDTTFKQGSRPGKFYVLKSKSNAAFSQCNGTIYLTEGLIKNLASLADLSVIIAHEIAHISSRDACILKESNDEDFISFDLDKEIKADKTASRILSGSFIDPKYFYSALRIQFSELSPNSKEKEDLKKRLEILDKNIQNIPEIHTKFPEERLFRKIKEYL